MVEWFKALVLKTSEVQASVGSNPTLSATILPRLLRRVFYYGSAMLYFEYGEKAKVLWEEVMELFKKERQASGCRYRKSRGHSKRIIPRYFRIAC